MQLIFLVTHTHTQSPRQTKQICSGEDRRLMVTWHNCNSDTHVKYIFDQALKMDFERISSFFIQWSCKMIIKRSI